MTRSFRHHRLHLAIALALLGMVVAAYADNEPSGPLRILLTNDDGWNAAGIVAVYDALVAAGHDVTVVAPLTNLFNHTWVPSGLVAAGLLGSTGTDDLKSRLRAILAKLPPATIRARALAVCHVDKRAALAKVTCPLLYLHGRNDRFIGRRHIREITAIRPDCEIHQLPAPHMLLESHPFQSAELIERFCRQAERTIQSTA